MKALGPYFYILFCLTLLACAEQEKSILIDETPLNTITTESNETAYLNIRDILNFTGNCEKLESRPLFPPPFDTLNFNKVIAYEFDGREGRGPTVFDRESGQFHQKIESQIDLNSKEILKLTSILTGDATYGGVTAACFEPKLGFIFYQDRSPKAVIDVCLDCNFLKSSIPFPETNYKIITYEDGVEVPQIGFTEQGVAEIVAFCAALNLNYGTFNQ